MKCEIERMEIIYTFYFFAFLKKVIKKLLTVCYGSEQKININIVDYLIALNLIEMKKNMLTEMKKKYIINI